MGKARENITAVAFVEFLLIKITMMILRSLITISAVLGCFKKEVTITIGDNYITSGYSCAADGKCLNSNVDQPSGNILCSSNFMFKEDAIKRCQIENRRTNLCEGMIEYSTKNGTRYELVNTAIDGCQQTEQFFQHNQFSKDFRFTRISPEMKQNRSRRSTPTISSSAIILEHGEKPFRQTMNFFQEDNMTVYEVDAHLEYTKNVIYRLHAFNTMVVVTPYTCLFADDSQKMEAKLESENPFFHNNCQYARNTGNSISCSGSNFTGPISENYTGPRRK